jgi:hypothetical protein
MKMHFIFKMNRQERHRRKAASVSVERQEKSKKRDLII